MTSYDKTGRPGSIHDTLGSATEQVSNAASRIQEQAIDAYEKQADHLSAAIRKKPLQSAAIAAALGFLFAVIARR